LPKPGNSRDIIARRASGTREFRLGTDRLPTATDGKSWLSFEDFAIVAGGQIEHPARQRSHFTVGYRPEATAPA
jgi:putative NADH-flavin reductase